MSNRDQISAAYAAGRDFAAELNATPAEAQNWHALTPDDEMPAGDYDALSREYGEVTLEMAEAYRNAFNTEFRG